MKYLGILNIGFSKNNLPEWQSLWARVTENAKRNKSKLVVMECSQEEAQILKEKFHDIHKIIIDKNRNDEKRDMPASI